MLLLGVLLAVLPGRVAIDAQTVDDGGLVSILVMGDSYSAGNGAGADSYYGAKGCWRSSQNYARQFQRIIELPPFNQRVFVENVACSGAVSADFFESKSGRPPELDAVNHGYDLIFLTIGGNDADFADIVKFCLVQTFRDGANCEPNLANAEALISDGTLQQRVEDVLEGIHERAHPSAKIILVGYPYLESDSEYQIRSGHGGPFIEVGKRLIALGDDGDDAQQAAVNAMNAAHGPDRFVFVDVKDLFGGHELAAQESNPDRWFVEPWADAGLAWRAWWYHPNSQGHLQEAGLLVADPRVPTTDLNGGTPSVSGHLVDVVLTIDTTGSMSDDIAAVKASSSSLVQELAAGGGDWRVAVVTYRDHPDAENPGDYPSRLELAFSSNVAAIQAAIDSIVVDGGGDESETVLSGIQLAVDQPWRDGAKKAIIVLGDAPPKNPEPITGLTSGMVIQAALNVDPAEIYPVLVNPDTELMIAAEELARGTGGQVLETADAGTVVGTLGEVLAEVALAPIGHAGGPYAGATGSSIELSASASTDPDGTIVSYEWDFENDGSFGPPTSTPLSEHTYNVAYSGLVSVRVTDDSGSATVAQAAINVIAPTDPSEIAPERTTPDPIVLGDEDSGGTSGIKVALIMAIVLGILTLAFALASKVFSNRRRPASPRATVDKLQLRVIDGPAAGSVLLVSSGEIIGRGADAHHGLVDATVSRRHAQVLWMDGRWAVIDVGSASGTARNGEYVQRASVSVGDRLTVGSTTLAVEGTMSVVSAG